jgi:hypothetical protein
VGNFIKTFWMPDTPLVALNILLAAVVIFTVRLGIETFTRTLGNILHTRITITDYFFGFHHSSSKHSKHSASI